MKYERISTACVDRLLQDGYIVREGDRAYLDEVTMIALKENEGKDLTDEDLIREVLSISSIYLKRIPETVRPSPAAPGHDSNGYEKPGFWDRAVAIFQAMNGGSREY